MGAVAADLALANNLIEDLAERLGGHLLEAALFGSRARGTAWPGSDFDVFLLIDHKTPARRDEIYTVSYAYMPADINFHIYTPDELARARRLGTPVPRAVAAEGVPLWPPTRA